MWHTSIRSITNAQNILGIGRVAWLDIFPPSLIFIKGNVVSPQVTSPFTGRGGTSVELHITDAPHNQGIVLGHGKKPLVYDFRILF